MNDSCTIFLLSPRGCQHSHCRPGSWKQQGRTWSCASSLVLIRAEFGHVLKHWLLVGSVSAALGAMISSRWVMRIGRRSNVGWFSVVAKSTRSPSLSKPVVSGSGTLLHLLNFQHSLFYTGRASVFCALSVVCSFISCKGLMLKEIFLGQLSQIN